MKTARPECGSEDYINMDLKETRWKSMGCVYYHCQG
jgi:hypothetical protein